MAGHITQKGKEEVGFGKCASFRMVYFILRTQLCVLLYRYRAWCFEGIIW